MSVGCGVLRLAEESQLLAEEKWIVEALTILKQQRNSLQIERLHLENLRATVNKEELRKLISSTDTEVTEERPVDVSSTPLMTSTEQTPSMAVLDVGVPSTSLSQFDVPIAGIDEDMCNKEELNLAVTNSAFAQQDPEAFDTEEDEEDLENCEIDMNMFMYGNKV